MESTTLVLTSTELTAITAVLTTYAMGLFKGSPMLANIVSQEQAEATLKAIGRQVGVVTLK